MEGLENAGGVERIAKMDIHSPSTLLPLQGLFHHLKPPLSFTYKVQ